MSNPNSLQILTIEIMQDMLVNNRHEAMRGFLAQVANGWLDKNTQNKIAITITDNWLDSPPWEAEQRKDIYSLMTTPFA